MMILDALRDWGCDVEGALGRFVGDEELYHMCLNTLLSDPAFAGLKEALNKKEARAAFEHAHTLKGVLANLGLIPMYDITVRMVEPLRAGEVENLLPIYEELMQAKETLADILR